MKEKTRQTLKIYWRHLVKYKGRVSIMFIALLGFTFSSIYTPIWYKKFFDLLEKSPDPERLIYIILIIAGINMIGWVSFRAAEFTQNYLEPALMKDLYITCYNYLHKHSYSFFNNNFSGSLVRRVNRFVNSFVNIFDTIYWSILFIGLKITVILGVLFYYFWKIGLITLFWIIFYLIFHMIFVRYKLKWDIKRADADSEVTGQLADSIVNNINIKLFNGYKFEEKRFKNRLKELSKLIIKSYNLGSIITGLQALLMIILEVGVFYIAVKLWQKGLVTIGDFVLLQAYIFTIFDSLWNIGRYIRRIYESLSDAEEMTEILTKPHEVKDNPSAKPLEVKKGEIVFQNVTFKYGLNTRYILQNFNLKIKPQEKIALIGPSGGGKSTIVKLLFRFFDIEKGEILIDGQNIADVSQNSLRESISLVPQEPILFHRTLMENIRYGRRSATDEEVIRAAKLAHCHEFIMSFPDKYNTYVGERGVKLSGGERQRVAIARAILKNAPILVLDEATSSLDSESELLIQDALTNLMQGKTVIVIAHRLSTISKMDRIVVIENGQISEEGKHNELLKASQGTYQKLWQIQAGGFIEP